MPILITDISAEILDFFEGDIYVFNDISGQIGFEDYISLYGFIAYLQNFSMVNYVENLQKPTTFGLKSMNNQPTITIEISY